MSSLFIETSVQIRRLTTRKGRKAVQSIISTIETPIIRTSLYCFMELRRTLIEDIIFVRDKLTEIEPDDNGLLRLSDIEIYLSNAPGIFSKRKCQRLFLVTAKINETFSNEESIPAKAIIDYLEVLIKEYERLSFNIYNPIEDSFLEVGLINGTKCSIFEEELFCTVDGQRMSCRKEHADCRIEELLYNFKNQLSQYAEMNYIDSPWIDTASTVRNFLLGQLTSLLGQRICWKVGDVLIATEAKESDCSKVLSYDRQFEILSKYLEMDCEILS